jgi:hypothetical protein
MISSLRNRHSNWAWSAYTLSGEPIAESGTAKILGGNELTENRAKATLPYSASEQYSL